ALEALAAAGSGAERGREDLDRDVAVEPDVTGAIHLAHAARAERRDDLVVAEQRACLQRWDAEIITVRPSPSANVSGCRPTGGGRRGFAAARGCAPRRDIRSRAAFDRYRRSISLCAKMPRMARRLELFKGTLALLILRTLETGPRHGIDIADRIEQI